LRATQKGQVRWKVTPDAVGIFRAVRKFRRA
jgi:hypothetical protein